MSTNRVEPDAIRKPGGKWHRGGRYDYPGEQHCPIGFGLVLMPRNCEREWADQTPWADMCRKCFPTTPAPTPAHPSEEADRG